jgi:hypothetical protein
MYARTNRCYNERGSRTNYVVLAYHKQQATAFKLQNVNNARMVTLQTSDMGMTVMLVIIVLCNISFVLVFYNVMMKHNKIL